MTYNPWPIGKVPLEFQRPELGLLRESGYEFDDAREVVGIFEERLATYSGSKYCVALDCASNAIFLCLKYLNLNTTIAIPRRTYVSIGMQIHHSGNRLALKEIEWQGLYQLGNTPIIDGAARFTPNMFVGGSDSLQILSFQIKKRLPIGRGGAILTNNREAAEWFKLSRYDGRDLNSSYDSKKHVLQLGWHMYMTPEDAARGLLILDKLGVNEYPDVANFESYPDTYDWFAKLGLI
jgi:dTDP-4-amino-4,6-dideoxygalactose transaminase